MADQATRVRHFAELVDAVIKYAETHGSGDDTSSMDAAGAAFVLRAAADKLDPKPAEPVKPAAPPPTPVVEVKKAPEPVEPPPFEDYYDGEDDFAAPKKTVTTPKPKKYGNK